jgi:hypothetical protein
MNKSTIFSFLNSTYFDLVCKLYLGRQFYQSLEV